MKLFSFTILVFSLNISGYSQQVPTFSSHAYSMQIVADSDGTSKGWQSCDFYPKFYLSKNNLDSIIIDSPKHVGFLLKKFKTTYTNNEITWYIYSGYDDNLFEDIEVRWGIFDKPFEGQIGILTIVYTIFTLNLKLGALPN